MNYISTSSSITTFPVSLQTNKEIMNTNTNKIIETELYRKHLYSNIIDKVAVKLTKYLEMKEIQHFMLRYIFNKIVERKPENDPVFISQYSDICLLQVEKDLEFKNIPISFFCNNIAIFHKFLPFYWF
jgi:hypothetical protein